MSTKTLFNQREMRADAMLKKLEVNNGTYLVLFPFLSLEGFTVLSLEKILTIRCTEEKPNSESRIFLCEGDNHVTIKVISEKGIEEVTLSATYTNKETKKVLPVDVDFMRSKIRDLPLSSYFFVSVTKKIWNRLPQEKTEPLSNHWFGPVSTN